jgi:hypothetical protein
VLDFMNPAGTGRRLFRRFRQAGLDGFMRECLTTWRSSGSRSVGTSIFDAP